MANINVTVQDGQAIRVDVGENTLATSLDRAAAALSAADAAQSAAYAGGFETPEYASQSAGNAATTAGDIFRVPLGTTPQTFNWYRRLASGSELVDPLATSGALAADDGAELIGSDDGAGGSLWTTVAGFITQLKSSVGASIVGFIGTGTGVVLRTVLSKLRDTVSVKDFGAVGDGVANDSAAIQAAIDHLDSLGGGVLFFPRGRYKCNVVLKSNVTLTSFATGAYGYLPNSLRNVTLEQAGAGFVVDTPSSSVYAASVVGINFQGGGAGVAGGGIRFRDVAWGAVKQCQFDQFADQAILKEGGEACAFEDILTTNVLLNRTRSTQNGCIELAGGADDFLSRVEANPSLGSSVSDTNLRVCAFVIRAANVFVSNCVGEFADYGYYTTGAYCRFVNCRADLNRGHGFHCGGLSQYTNCTSLSNGQAAAGTYDGFRAMGQGDSFSNCVSRNISSTVRYAFYDPANFGAVTSRNTYFNCQGSEFTLGKFFLEGFAGSSPVEPGTPAFSDTATPDTTGTTFIVLTHASATTVTDFLGGFSGKTVRFLGNANVTIQHGTNIFTNTGANKVLAAQKVYTFTRYNGVWYEEA